MEMAADFRKEERFRRKEELYYVIDEKQLTSDLTEKGRNAVHPENPDAFVLPTCRPYLSEIDSDKSMSAQEKQEAKLRAEDKFIALSEDIHCVSQLLRAYSIYEKDVEYVVQGGKVHIVDPNTGRIMYGRRWSEGLHQAVEAKENVAIEKETKTYATITIQNYFRLYEKLAGMTGTAETEAQEFHDIYGLNVMAIPTNKPCRRIDKNDVIYKTRREKYKAAIEEIKASHERGQPGARRHGVRRGKRCSQQKLEPLQNPPHRPKRQAPRAGGRPSSPTRAKKGWSQSPPIWRGAERTLSSARASKSSAGSTCSAPSATNRAA